MPRTPDEIKKDLKDALPDHVHFHKGDPEPHLTHFNYHELECLHADALAYIRQLEAERDAAVNDLRYAVSHPHTAGVCYACKHHDDCEFQDDCDTLENNHWEWRGVQKEE